MCVNELLDRDDGLGPGDDCPVCGIPLTPRQVEVTGHPAIEMYCPDHGVQLIWTPFSDQ